METIIDVGYRLYDVGLWRELASLADHSDVRTGGSGEIIARYFRALSLRRTNSIFEAQNLLGELRPKRDQLGKHANSLDLEIAYLHEIAGGYTEAREKFSALYARCIPFDPKNRTHVKSLLYYADMLIMDGALEKGADLLLEGCELVDQSDPINMAELLRQRAHAFRFSFLFDEAEGLYLKAFSIASDVPSLKAKLTGNIAECQCWTDPELAIKNARSALELNERLRNLIEVGKNHTALSLAYSALGSRDAAETHYKLAKETASAVGYAAGVLFSNVAGCIATARTPPLFQQRLSQLQVSVENLGTYRHQLLIPFLLNGNEEMFASIVADCAWIEPDTIVQRAKLTATRFGRHFSPADQ